MENGRKIGGWLIFFGIGLILSLIYELTIIYRYINLVIAFDFNSLTTHYSQKEANLIFFETFYPFLALIILILINLFLLYLFFSKNKEFPKAYIYLNITIITIVMSFELLSALYGEVVYFKNTMGAIVSFVVWGIYLIKSKRVKETFINLKRKKYVKLTEEEYELLKKNYINNS